MDTSTVGLDIGTSQIKVLQFNPSKKELTFLYNGALPFEVMQNKISPQKNEEEGFLAELIKTLFKESPLDKNRVVILVQGDDIVYEYLELHKMNPRELSVALPIESRKFVSHVLEEMHFTFAYAPILPPKQKAYTTGILLTAVPKKLISERMQLLHECGINPLAIEVPAIPLCRVHTYTPKPQKEEKTIALLDIGAKYTNISVVREGVVYFSKDLLIGGNNFTHALELGGPYSFAEAEARKRELRFLG